MNTDSIANEIEEDQGETAAVDLGGPLRSGHFSPELLLFDLQLAQLLITFANLGHCRLDPLCRLPRPIPVLLRTFGTSLSFRSVGVLRIDQAALPKL